MKFSMRFTVLSCLIIASQAIAENVPPHLASMAKEIYQQKVAPLRAGSHATAENTLLSEGIALIESASMRHWSDSEIRIPGVVDEVASALELDLRDPEQWAELHLLLSAPGRHKQYDLLRKIAQRQEPSTDAGQLMSKFDEARQTALISLDQRYVMALEKPDSSLELLWNPFQSAFRMTVKAGRNIEGQGNGFRLALQGRVEVQMQADSDDLVLSVSADDDPPLILTNDEIQAMSEKLEGRWMESDLSAHPGTFWDINLEEPNQAADQSPSIDQQIEALKEQIREIENTRVFRWENPDSGEVSDQAKFRRMQEPWVYRGEVNAHPDAETQIINRQDEIARLLRENQPLPVEQYDPVRMNEESTSSEDAMALAVAMTFPGGHQSEFEHARYLDGRITARRTLDHISDITNLPSPIVRELVASWSPPEWIELDINPDPNTGRLSLDGSRWRLHVTWSDFYGPEVESIHTPFSRKLELIRPGGESAEGAKPSEQL